MSRQTSNVVFSGNVYIFHSFDIGDDINLEKLKESGLITLKPITPSKYFKNYHIPLSIELPNFKSQNDSNCISAKLHNFGVISLVYKVPFTDTLENLRAKINDIEYSYSEKSLEDASNIFKNIKEFIKQANFFQLRNEYLVVQVNPQEGFDTIQIKEEYGSVIASILRFETETLSEYQKNDILESAIGYFRGDLIIIDTEAAFVYDDQYDEFLEFFEFGNIQQLELQYFDKVLDKQLNVAYKREVQHIPLSAYLPFVSTTIDASVGDLGRMRVDISVIIEQIENSIKFTGEAYYLEFYQILAANLELSNWKDSINKKLLIIQDVRNVYQHKADAAREDLLSILVILLIFIELIFGILSYFK